ncbi:heptaprenyl diphosphate synthase component 1 [Neobacillus soli]|uniref:heptaprenyl diphosphate synthase component 1 n=1 Tax=Neobacillus soli TaxID=220688 RepID=UPI001FCFCD98|nr:heptaprenyl diphosphate synthase component 1 [Neobacillus soli]
MLKYIETPVIDEDKLLILISIMDRLELSFNEMQNYALSTMLIQIALDTHEHISDSSEDEKNRQLTVLAGDYFSGLYYKLLAESEDILMIKALSQGIKEVNENKILVYQKEFEGIEKLMTSIKHIESSLLLMFADYFKVDLWKDFLANLLLFKRLFKEKSQYIQAESSVLFDALKKITFPIHNNNLDELSIEQQNELLMICDHYLDHSKLAVEKGLKQLPFVNDLLKRRITSILGQYKPYVKTFVEEG